MVSIQTKLLRQQADTLQREASRYDYKFLTLEKCTTWVKQQEFDEKNDICRILLKQEEELERQKKDLFLLAEVLQRVCSKYDRTEQKIQESLEKGSGVSGIIEKIELGHINQMLKALGMNISN